VQTSIAVDADCSQLLEELARAAHVTLNALAVASLQAGLPAQSDAARAAIVDERIRRAGVTAARIERNLRLPEQLRARIDELVAAARERLPRVSRADLVNAALRGGLPANAEQAAELVCEYARRVERAAAA
jgi:Arc/MetJ-type ribon-helix-helix transcriptional regulator